MLLFINNYEEIIITNQILPSVFLGKITDITSSIAVKYFQTLNDFFKKFSEANILVITCSMAIQENEFELQYDPSFKDKVSISEIKSILQQSGKNLKGNSVNKTTMVDYFERIGVNKSKILYLTVNISKVQFAMELGKNLQIIRWKNFILLGLGNITHLLVDSDGYDGSFKEFDSWVRVKLWEFDYYALRDIETFFPLSRHLYLDKISHYIPFLIVFGSLLGTDVLTDLYHGFEDFNSLRSFYFTSFSNNNV